jgi:activating signal cointegrator 1
VKALSVWQPWATLIAIGAKEYETRHWQAPGCIVGHDVVIHASKTRDEMGECYHEPFRSVLKAAGFTRPSDLPFGAAVCIARCDGSYLADDLVARISEQERCFGNYGTGRFGWKFSNLRRFLNPPAARGAQGIFVLPDALVSLPLHPSPSPTP